jgi:menaquinone-dependent protoporphyrinogen oxidase
MAGKAEKGINRRRFLQAAGIGLGAGALACGGAAFFATREPEIDFPETECGKEDAMGDKLLIAYASKCGSTGEVAEAVGRVLCGSGLAADIERVQDVKDLSGYRAVVLGTAIRMGKPLSEMTDFAKKNRSALSALPVACFHVGMSMREDTAANREKAQQSLAPLLQSIPAPAAVGLFAGKVDYSKLAPIFRWMFSQDKSGDMAEGDWRDWDAINAWAQSLAPLLQGAPGAPLRHLSGLKT